MKNKRQIHFIPHTHWDREWYFSQNDAALLSTMSFLKAIETLENNPEYPCYNFDAQTSIIADLLELRPDLKNRIAKLVAERRLFIGPWYTQTDTFYADGESIIRNLYFGTMDADKLGRSMKIGYLPDTFGHNIQMPQIFKGFDIDNIIFWRGYNPEKTPEPYFNWEGADGTNILAANITFGYSGLRYNIIRDEKNFDGKFIASSDKLVKLTDKENLFLPLGGDQELINEHLVEDVNKLNEHTSKLDKDYEFSITDYETFIDKLKKEIGDLTSLQTFNEELRDPVKARIHRTIGSSRYDIKRKSFDLEHKLVNILEPLTVIFYDAIDRELVNKNVLEKSWKLLLDGHAHDSLGACNTDITNENVINRFKQAEDLIDGTINILQKTIGTNIKDKFNKSLVLYNFDTVELNNADREVTIYSSTPKVEIYDGVSKVDIEYLKTEELSGGKLVTHTANGDVEEELPPYYKHKLLMQVNMKSFGYKSFEIKEVSSTFESNYYESNTIENSKIKFEVTDNKVNITDKSNGFIYKDIISFENVGNDGDSYDFSPMKGTTPINDITIESCRAKEISSEIKELIFIVKMKVPEKAITRTERSTKLVDLDFEVVLQLVNDKLNFKINVLNNAKDHRVRLFFNFENDGIVKTDIPFGFMERDYIKEPDNWKEFMVEKPVNYYPIINTFYKEKEGTQFIVNTKGIKEIEITEERNVFLTLWKSDEYLGKDDLEFRPNRASGMNNKVIKTYDAQLFDKELEFEFQITLQNNLSEDNINLLKREYICKFDSYQLQRFDILSQNLERWFFPIKDYNLEEEKSIISAVDEVQLVSSYVSYKDDSIVLRYMNLGENEVESKQLEEKLLMKSVNFAEEFDSNKNTLPKYGLLTLKK